MFGRHLDLVLVLAVIGCGSHHGSRPTAKSTRVAGDGATAFAVEDARISQLVADALCACKGPACDELDSTIGIPTATEDYGLFIDLPSFRDDLRPPFASSFTLELGVDSCWDQVASWEFTRGQHCLQAVRGDTRPSDLGPRPTCGNSAGPGVLHKPTLAAWWSSAVPCPAPTKLVTEPNLIAPDKLVRAACVDTDEHNVTFGSGRETTWHLSGSLRSDGSYKKGERHGGWSWWYPHGLRAQAAQYNVDIDPDRQQHKTGTWTGWFPTGQIAYEIEYGARIDQITAREYWPDGGVRLDRTADGKARWWTRSGKEIKADEVALGRWGYVSEM